MSKKALDVTTRGWSKKDITQLTQIVNETNYRWVAKVKTKDDKIKYCHFNSKIDLEIMAIQVGFKILKVARK